MKVFLVAVPCRSCEGGGLQEAPLRVFRRLFAHLTTLQRTLLSPAEVPRGLKERLKEA